MQPAHWPTNLQYLTIYAFHSSVSKDTKQFISPRTSASTSIKVPVTVRAITSPNHPAVGQFGLFATTKIDPKTFILDYIGEVHCDERTESDYDLSLHRFQTGESIGIDASKMGNEARFINDYRGIAERPNAMFEERRTDQEELRMSVWSGSKAIKKGEEILVSYGKSWWAARTGNNISDAKQRPNN